MQADLKTFQELNTYGMVALTCCNNGQRNLVSRCDTTSNGCIRKQLETVISIGPDVKTGMLGTEEIIKRLAKHLNNQVQNIS